MKRILFFAFCLLGLSIWPSGRAEAQLEIIEDAIKAAIMAVDLAVQKVQTQTINLQEAEKELENQMEQSQLGEIIGWVQQQKDLYSEYYQELWQVKNAIASFQKVVDMIDKQVRLVSDYKKAYAIVGRDPHFSAAEIIHIYAVYQGILSQSIQNITQLKLAINALVTQMTDGERLHIIDATGERIDRNYNDLKKYTQQNIMLSLQRAKNANDLDGIKTLYGIP